MANGQLSLNLNNKGGRAIALVVAFGTGLNLLYILHLISKTEPRALLNIVGEWGPAFVLSALVIWLGDRRLGELLVINRENVAAQVRMADAMHAIAHKDDERARETDLLIGEMTRNSQAILRHIAEFERKYSIDVMERLVEIEKYVKGQRSPGNANGHSAS